MPLVSVVIPNWNGAHLLPICLDSLCAQTLRDFEVILVDNGSTDGSLELVAARYPGVQIVRFPRNMGFCLAMNAGLRAARGEFAFPLNNDTELDPRCLEEAVAAMRADPGVGIVAAKMVYYEDPGLINSAGHACADDGVVVDIGRLQPDSEWFHRPREVLGACAGACLYRKVMLDEIGLFDPDFFMSYEDIDLDWRAQLAGWRALYAPSARVLHREGTTRPHRSKRALCFSARNLLFVWVKNWPLPMMLCHLPAIWRGWRARLRSLFVFGYGASLPGVVLGALALTPRMLGRRRQVQARRVIGRRRLEHLLAIGARHARRPPQD